MGAIKRKKAMTLFKRLTVRKSVAVFLGVCGVIALICVFACQQTAGVKRSATTTQKAGSNVAKKAAKEGVTAELSNKHCVFCHPQQPQTIEAKGGLHKTEVGCMDCHQEHPPEGTDAVPECSMCHSGAAHYDLEGCSSCHSDAHAPLDLKLEGELTEPCLTCHQQQGDELKEHPSMHTELPCNECHSSHGEIPNCMDCHEKHTEDMDYEACVSCHPVHMPRVVTYGQDTPSRYCGACHGEALDLLEANTTKHHDLLCVFCHKNKHKTVPPCYACHPQAHSKAILDKFPECGHCHSTAHDLKG